MTEVCTSAPETTSPEQGTSTTQQPTRTEAQAIKYGWRNDKTVYSANGEATADADSGGIWLSIAERKPVPSVEIDAEAGTLLTLDQARQLAKRVLELVDALTPAGPDGVAALRTMADAIGVTIEVPERATQNDLREISLWLAEQLAERRA